MDNDIKTMLKEEDLYKLLGVDRDVEDAQIQKIYKKLALRYHPDKNGSEEAKEVFRKIKRAKDVLLDHSRRSLYDQLGHDSPDDYMMQFNQVFIHQYAP